MGARQKIERYGLSSQKSFSQIEAKDILRKRGFVLNARNARCVFPHSRRESLKHWAIKSIMLKILMDRGRNAGSEIEVGNGIADIFDSDTGIAYEIESRRNGKSRREKTARMSSAKDVLFIDSSKVPDDIFKARKYLDKIVV